ncbi:MAG: YcjF family protein [Hyphomicrobiales bacterium]
MSRSTTSNRRPRAFKPDDIRLETGGDEAIDPLPQGALEPGQEPRVEPLPFTGRGWRWGGIFLSALAGLLLVLFTDWVVSQVTALVSRGDWLGWLALGLAGLAAFAALALALREILALFRLVRLGDIRITAEDALRNEDAAAARTAATGLKRLYAGRAELAWGQARLKEHAGAILDARETLTLAERELLVPLDLQARAIVAAAAKRIAVVTAISPLALLDMAIVAVQGLRMLRQLAGLYGARPGMLALLKLLRQVATHIVLTGGVAIGDDLVQQMIGHRLTAKLSAKLGEGMFNGAMTARVGLAAIDLCRPLPFIEARRPRFRDLVAEVARVS